MTGRNLVLFALIGIFSSLANADDLGHSLAGDSVEDVLGSAKIPSNTPFILNGESADAVETAKTVGEDYHFNHGIKEVTENATVEKKYKDFGYTTPGTFENQENYLETDKIKMVRDFRQHSAKSFTMTFIKNDYDYQSNNDIINRTIRQGSYKSVKGGGLYVRYDTYIFKTKMLNTHWSVGAGAAFSSGKGIFIDGNRSDTTFKLWEVPIEAGVGLEIPITHWFKITGTGGPSVMAIVQNRSDFQRGEAGKRKIQVSPGYFASAQFKVNLMAFNEENAYEIFTSSEITNIFMNLEARMHSYSNFQDPIQISGASFGVGFTFEYL